MEKWFQRRLLKITGYRVNKIKSQHLNNNNNNKNIKNIKHKMNHETLIFNKTHFLAFTVRVTCTCVCVGVFDVTYHIIILRITKIYNGVPFSPHLPAQACRGHSRSFCRGHDPTSGGARCVHSACAGPGSGSRKIPNTAASCCQLWAFGQLGLKRLVLLPQPFYFVE